EMAVRGSINDAVGILGGGEPSERVARRWRRPGEARQIVLPDHAVRTPVKAADVLVSAPEDDNVGRADGIIIGPWIARRRDRVRLSGQIAMADAALSLPPQFVKMAIGRAVNDVVKGVVRREPARRVARRLGRVDRAGEIVVA